MKYIKRIILENFQSHKNSTIDLDERLNVIVGPSDSGKSAIIRGIKWALYNEPSGDYFIREGERECSVTLEFNDNSILKRYRNKSKNSYILINNKGEEKIYEGFGSNVPEEIIDTIGIKKINLDSNDSASINLGEQLEGAFLLSERTSTRASAIGRLVGVNVIDDALRETLKDSRSLSTSKKYLEEIVLNTKEELKNYEYLDEMKIRLDKLLNIKTEISTNLRKLETLKSAYERLSILNLDINETTTIIGKFERINSLEKSILDMDKRYNRYTKLNSININLNKIIFEIEENNKIKYKLKNLDNVMNLSVTIERLNIRYNQLENLKYKDKLREKENITIFYYLEKLLTVDDINPIIEEILKSNTQFIKLIDLKSKMISINKSINTGQVYISNFGDLNLVDNNIRNINKNINILTKLSNLYKLLVINNENYENEYKSLSVADLNINNQLERYQDLLKEVEVCPFCLSDINEDKIHHIINHYIGG